MTPIPWPTPTPAPAGTAIFSVPVNLGNFRVSADRAVQLYNDANAGGLLTLAMWVIVFVIVVICVHELIEKLKH